VSTKKTRGRYGQGSIALQPNGRFKATFPAGTDSDGTRRRQSKVFDTRRQADLWLTERRQQNALGMKAVRERLTVEQFADWWIRVEAPLTTRSDTANHYLVLFNRYIRPSLGTKHLDELNSDDVVDLLSRLTRRGLSHNTARRARSVLSILCRQALRHRYIAHNPVAVVKPPRPVGLATSRVREPLSVDETHALLESVRSTDLEGVVFVATYLGLRKGEILGLQWSDIDLDKRIVTIRRTLKEGSTILPDGSGLTHARTNPPKTRNSQRSLPLPDIIYQVLIKQKRRQATSKLRVGDAWQDTGFVFTNDLGGSLWPSNVGKRFRTHLRKQGLRHIRFHDLRHTCAKLMLEGGARLEEVSQALGHSTIAITKDTYARYVETLSHRAVNTLADLLEGDQSADVAVGQSRPTRTSRPPTWGGDS